MNARRVILQAACVSVGALVAVSALSARPNGQSTQGQAANNQPNVAQPAVSTPVTGQGTKIRPGRTGGVMNKASAKPVQRTAGKPAQPTTMPVSAPAAGGGAFTIPSNPSSNQPQNAPQAQNMSAPQPTGQPFQANPQMNQNLDKWVNAVKPNEHHKQLEAFVGTWNAEVTFSNFPTGQNQPGGAAKQTGTVKTSWAHGGRFLRSEYTGGPMGPNSSASATFGYNNAAKTFEGTWIDSNSTGIRVSSGQVDAAGKVFTFNSELADPMTPSKVKFKEVFTVNSESQYTRQLFEVGANGTEHKLQEVVYTRVR